MKTNPISYSNRRGFTITEMLVTVALFALIISALVALYQGYSTLFVSEQKLFTMRTSANIAITKIEQDTLQANRVVASRVISGTTYTTGSSMLVLELPSIDVSGGIISDTFDHVVFYVSGAILYRLTEANLASARQSGIKQLLDTLSALTLSYDTGDPTEASRITVDLVLLAQSGQSNSQFHFQQNVYLRNK